MAKSMRLANSAYQLQPIL